MALNKEKIALFDFCETLANFQTADAFIDYIRKRKASKLMRRKEEFRLFLNKMKVITILNRFFPKSSINKRLVLWQLKGLMQEEVELYAQSYYIEVIKNNLITNVVDELKRYQKEDWRIIIISAGYDVYLKYFCLDFGISIDDLIAVKIKFNKKKCSGTFYDGDRLWDKTQKLDKLYKKDEIQSIAFSDSTSDLPLLLWADEGVVVRNKKKQDLFKNYKFKQILWDN